MWQDAAVTDKRECRMLLDTAALYFRAFYGVPESITYDMWLDDDALMRAGLGVVLDNADGIDRQVTDCTRLLEREGIPLARVITDNDVSASTEKMTAASRRAR